MGQRIQEWTKYILRFLRVQSTFTYTHIVCTQCGRKANKSPTSVFFTFFTFFFFNSRGRAKSAGADRYEFSFLACKKESENHTPHVETEECTWSTLEYAVPYSVYSVYGTAYSRVDQVHSAVSTCTVHVHIYTYCMYTARPQSKQKPYLCFFTFFHPFFFNSRGRA